MSTSAPPTARRRAASSRRAIRSSRSALRSSSHTTASPRGASTTAPASTWRSRRSRGSRPRRWRCDVAVVATAQEELGHSGVPPAMHTLRPDLAVALDVTYATDVPAGDANEAGDHRLGTGPALFRGPAISPRVFELLVAAAEGDGIAHTVETGMKSYTDADDTFTSGAGVPTGLVSIPLRYMHSATEIVQLSDLEDCVRLLVALRAQARARHRLPSLGWPGDPLRHRLRRPHAVRAARRRARAPLRDRARLDRDPGRARPRRDRERRGRVRRHGPRAAGGRRPGTGTPGRNRRRAAEGDTGRHDQQGLRVVDPCRPDRRRR